MKEDAHKDLSNFPRISLKEVGTCSDEVALALQKVHEIPDPSTEVTIDTYKGDMEIPSRVKQHIAANNSN